MAVTAVVLTHSLIRVCSFSPLFFCFLSHSLSFTITEFITHSGGGGWPVEEEAEEGEGKKQTLNTSRHSVCTLLRANGAHRGSSSTSLLASLSAQLHHDHNRKEHNIPTSVGCSRLPTTDDRPTDRPTSQPTTTKNGAAKSHRGPCLLCLLRLLLATLFTSVRQAVCQRQRRRQQQQQFSVRISTTFV